MASPCRNVFVLLVPEHATEQHLQLLSELAQMFSERRFRERARGRSRRAGIARALPQLGLFVSKRGEAAGRAGAGA